MTGGRYRIVLRGRLAERFEPAFDGMVLEPGHGQTVLVGEIRDQAHLYGLLDRLRDFGIDLVAVEPEVSRATPQPRGRERPGEYAMSHRHIGWPRAPLRPDQVRAVSGAVAIPRRLQSGSVNRSSSS